MLSAWYNGRYLQAHNLASFHKLYFSNRENSHSNQIKGELTPSALYLSDFSFGPLEHIYAYYNLYISTGNVISCIY